jgi:hypothetical protein
MKRLAPALREIGIEYGDGRDPGGTRTRRKYLKKGAAKDRPHRPYRPTDDKIPANSGIVMGRSSDDEERSKNGAAPKTVPDETPAKEHLWDDGDGRDDDLRRESKAGGSEIVCAIRQLFEMHPEAKRQTPEQIADDLYIWTNLGYEPKSSEVREVFR